ncbi:DUF3696 domain-containing protein [Vibrio fluvialis]|nr:DUF3696 domain-containing protein [Vibrio fluvialis]
MIKKVSITGYKTFKNEEFYLKNLTVLTGINGSGKSSLIQSIRMLFSAENDRPFLKGLGDYSELKSLYAGAFPLIEISAHDERGNENKLELGEDIFTVNRSFNPFIEYISAERLGPKTSLPIKLNHSIGVGEQGEFCADFFNKFKGARVCASLRHPDAAAVTLESQLTEWMRGISPNLTFTFNVDKAHDISTIEIDSRRATNTGFGISYSLPIVLSALVLSSESCTNFEYSHAEFWYNQLKTTNPILIVENPEAHVHPSGQTQLGILLALLSTTGVQVIMETHSDHVIDGVRIAVKECEQLDPDEVTIKHFIKEPSKPSTYENISVQPNGSLSHWPVGFFDQMQENLRRIAKRK